jgi:hypothetical protein
MRRPPPICGEFRGDAGGAGLWPPDDRQGIEPGISCNYLWIPGSSPAPSSGGEVRRSVGDAPRIDDVGKAQPSL